jgi:hypothetical protein
VLRLSVGLSSKGKNKLQTRRMFECSNRTVGGGGGTANDGEEWRSCEIEGFNACENLNSLLGCDAV